MVLIRPCRSTAALEAIPESDWDLDLAKLEPRLVGDGWTSRVNAVIMLIVRKAHEATIFRNGRVLIKTQDVDVAEAVWNDLEPRLLEVRQDGS